MQASILTRNWQDTLSKTAAAPFERMKLLLQLQGEMVKSGRLAQPYNGVIDCFQRTVKEEGFGSLWHGYIPQLLRTVFADTITPHITAYVKKLIPVYQQKQGYWKWFLSTLFGGGLTGMTTLLFVYPLDYATTRLNVDIVQANKGGERQFEGVQDLITKTIASDGIAGLYQGYAVSVLGIIAYRAAYFALFDALGPIVKKKSKNSFWASFAFGFGVTVAAGLVTYPLDTIRRRQMMTCGESYKYTSAWDAFNQITAKEGVMALFNGALMNIVRGFVGAAMLALGDTIAARAKKQQQH